MVDIHHAGTAMRFLTVFFCKMKGREVVLFTTHDRAPIVLVEALEQLSNFL
jgi:5-enolpyruvylshikimate-3-phosphate synthase